MNKTNDDINRKIDNELKKKKLEKDYGAQFSKNSELPSEIESEWLNSIEQFEQQFDKKKTIKLWDYIGKPVFKKIHEIAPEQVSYELNRLYNILSKNNIVLDALSDVEDKELYRFITDELLEYEMDNIRIEGMTTNFIYEEFHPNAELDIRQAYDYFFRMTLAKSKNIGGDGYDLLYIDTNNYLNAEGNPLSKEHVKNSINNFLHSFDHFEIVSNEIKNIAINEEKTDAKLTFDIHYKGCFNKSKEFADFKGSGTFRLKPSEYGGWDIYHITLPGLKI